MTAERRTLARRGERDAIRFLNAVADAVAKAGVLADAAGVDLGPIISIIEGGISAPGPQLLEARSFAGVPIAVGETTISASVGMVFAITE